MTRSQLINQLLIRMPHLLPNDAEAIIETIFEEMCLAMISDGRVEFRGFGSFSVRSHKPKIGRNPRNGEKINVPRRHFPFFKAGKDMRRRLNADLSS